MPFVAASILVETAFSWLQKRWNKLQINVAWQMPAGSTKRQLDNAVMTEVNSEVKSEAK